MYSRQALNNRKDNIVTNWGPGPGNKTSIMEIFPSKVTDIKRGEKGWFWTERPRAKTRGNFIIWSQKPGDLFETRKWVLLRVFNHSVLSLCAWSELISAPRSLWNVIHFGPQQLFPRKSLHNLQFCKGKHKVCILV